MLRFVSSSLALALVVPVAAQTATTITSSCRPNVVYTFNAGGIPATATSTSGGSANLRWAGTAGQDQLFESWWSYRVNADTREFYFNRSATSGLVNPASPYVIGPKGDTAAVSWVNVDGKGFDARLLVTAYSTAVFSPNNGIVSMCLEITNRSGASMTLNLYHYADYDTCGAFNNSATLGGTPLQEEITDPSCAIKTYHLACGYTNYETTNFAVVRGKLTNAVVDNLLNTGIPYGPGDWTNAYQWQDVVIPDGATRQFYIGLSCDRRIPCCDPSTLENYCVAKAGTNGLPAWGSNRLFIGGTSELKITNGFPGSAPYVMLGNDVCIAVAPFGTLAINPVLIDFFMPAFDGTNTSKLCLDVPDDAALCGSVISAQAWFVDPGAAGFPVAHTDGAKHTVGSL
jgi:hypothetical protein